MKINSENAKRQRAIARRMKSGKSLVGLLAGLAVGAAMTGCDSSERDGMAIRGDIACPVELPAKTNLVEEVVGPEIMGAPPPAPAETNAVNEAGDEVTAGLIIDGEIDIGDAEVPES